MNTISSGLEFSFSSSLAQGTLDICSISLSSSSPLTFCCFGSGLFSSLFLDLYSSFDSVDLFYHLLFSEHWADFVFVFLCVGLAKENVFGTLHLALLSGTNISSWSFRISCSMFPCAMLSLHCCMNISSALFLFLFVSKSVGPLPCRHVEFVWKPVYSLSWTMKWHMSQCVAIDSHILWLVFSMAWPTSAKLRPEMQKPLKAGTMWNLWASHHSHQLSISFALQISTSTATTQMYSDLT